VQLTSQLQKYDCYVNCTLFLCAKNVKLCYHLREELLLPDSPDRPDSLLPDEERVGALTRLLFCPERTVCLFSFLVLPGVTDREFSFLAGGVVLRSIEVAFPRLIEVEFPRSIEAELLRPTGVELSRLTEVEFSRFTGVVLSRLTELFCVCKRELSRTVEGALVRCLSICALSRCGAAL
jgi:hypothetical protein